MDTHRKTIIKSLLCIALMTIVSLLFAIYMIPESKEIIMAIITIISNICSGMVGFYIGKSKEEKEEAP